MRGLAERLICRDETSAGIGAQVIDRHVLLMASLTRSTSS